MLKRTLTEGANEQELVKVSERVCVCETERQ